MKWVIFGLSISSSWGNGHATLWRGLCRHLAKQGHEVTFFERDVPYYAAHRDMAEPPYVNLILYQDWDEVRWKVTRELGEADVGVVTSYCPDALAAADSVLSASLQRRVFYDLDTPVTLERLKAGQRVDYIGPRGYRDFDLVLSFTGGRSLTELRNLLGAKVTAPLYGGVDPQAHRSGSPRGEFRCDLSYLGTFASDRQSALESLFVAASDRARDRRFLLGGSMYPESFPWRPNIKYVRHVPPGEHPDFFASSRLTLNITRKAMARLGFCPSGRLFEAAACGTPLVSDHWEGLEEFFEPESEILIARNTEDVLRAMELSDRELRSTARAARERVLAAHTAERRAIEFERLVISPPTEESMESKDNGRGNTWGIIPAAGAGTRIQPLAFSKELLPVGSRLEGETERPRAASEYLLDRMVRGGAKRICFVISAGKTDIMSYYGGEYGPANICYAVQPKPEGLCDAIFRAAPLIGASDSVLIGLPDSIWFPDNGFNGLPDECLSFLLFPVDLPQLFDAVVTDAEGHVKEIQVKQPVPSSRWIWGAFKLPGDVFHDLRSLWLERGRRDEYFGTLVNAYLASGGRARGVRTGTSYVDVGTLNGYREALSLLSVPVEFQRSA